MSNIQKIEEDSGLRSRGYSRGVEIGRGTYGIVYEGYMNGNECKKVAMKKVKTKGSCIDFSFLREVKLLQELHNENILGLLDVFVEFKPETNLWLVSEFMETDLKKIIDEKSIQISASDCKSYMNMLLKGVEYLHSNWILHRDLCPGNLLISPEGILKIGDFGLAKKFGYEDVRFTPEVVTRWYRAPELLFGARYYGRGVDMWSVGCIFAEMMLRMPYFAGDNDIDQLRKIFGALGTPKTKDWQYMELLPGFFQFTSCEATPLNRIFTSASDDALELLGSLLKFDPNLRPSASEIFKNFKYFHCPPAMTPPDKLILRRPQRRNSMVAVEVTTTTAAVEVTTDKMDIVTSPRAV